MHYKKFNNTQSISDLVSVIIPCFNENEKLCRAISSVLNQTYENIEIIVADDGSTDNSIELVQQKFANKITVLELQHSGHPNNPRNEALNVAKGEYICFLDADDAYTPDKIEKQIKYIKLNPQYDIIYCDSKLADSQMKVYNESWFKDKARMREGDIFKYTLNILNREYQGFQLSPEWLFFRKSILFDTGLMTTEVRYLSDWEFGLRLAAKYKIGCVKESLTIQDRGDKAIHYSNKFNKSYFYNPYYYIIQVVTLIKNLTLTKEQEKEILIAIPNFMRRTAVRQILYKNPFIGLYYIFKAMIIQPKNFENFIMLIKLFSGFYLYKRLFKAKDPYK